MPPKARYSREKIIDVAYEMVRKNGEDCLSARTIAKELGCSTAPIFTVFSSIEELYDEVVKRAKALYDRYIEEGFSATPAFKGTGMKYIQFAKDEPELFRMLFMRATPDTPPSHYFPSGDDNEPLIRKNVERTYEMDEERARKLYNHLSVYVHGIAVLFAQGICVFTDEDVSRMLSEMFLALTKGEKL